MGENKVEGEIVRAGIELNEGLNILEEEIDALGIKLSSVIMQEGPVPGGADKLSEPSYGTPLGQDINKKARQVRSLISKVRSIKSRIEL